MALYKENKINPLSGCLPDITPTGAEVFFASPQVAVRHYRNAPDPLLWLDPGSVRAGSNHDLHPVRPDPLVAARLPDARFLAPADGCHHVRADAAEPGAARSRTLGHDVPLRPIIFTLYIAPSRPRPGDLLFLEQLAFDLAADLHHEEEWPCRESNLWGSSQGDVRSKKNQIGLG